MKMTTGVYPIYLSKKAAALSRKEKSNDIYAGKFAGYRELKKSYLSKRDKASAQTLVYNYLVLTDNLKFTPLGPNSTIEKSYYLQGLAVLKDLRSVIVKNNLSCTYDASYNDLDSLEYDLFQAGREPNLLSRQFNNALVDSTMQAAYQGAAMFKVVGINDTTVKLYPAHLQVLSTIVAGMRAHSGRTNILGDEDIALKQLFTKKIKETFTGYDPENTSLSKPPTIGDSALEVSMMAFIESYFYTVFSNSEERLRFASTVDEKERGLISLSTAFMDCYSYLSKKGYRPEIYQIQRIPESLKDKVVDQTGNINPRNIVDYCLLVKEINPRVPGYGKWVGISMSGAYPSIKSQLLPSTRATSRRGAIRAFPSLNWKPTNEWKQAVQVSVGDFDGDGQNDLYVYPLVTRIIRNSQ